MTFSHEWDAVYRHGGQLSVWPWSDLVSMVMRYARPTGPAYRVAELGCGAGANIPFFLNLNVDYYAIEGSPHMVALLKGRYPQLADRLLAGDFTQDIPFPGPFDLIVDRSSLTHNSTRSIQRCLKIVYDKLKPGGAFIGIDWFSTEHSELPCGKIADDEYTRDNFSSGQFTQVGKVHFSDEKHLRFLLEDFNVEVMERKTVVRREPRDHWRFASWNFLAVKKQ
jgi:SAM-dependent methyltransferase